MHHANPQPALVLEVGGAAPHSTWQRGGTVSAHSSMAPSQLPTFRVLSRLDLKIATGGFREEDRLGAGPRCVPNQVSSALN